MRIPTWVLALIDERVPEWQAQCEEQAKATSWWMDECHKARTELETCRGLIDANRRSFEQEKERYELDFEFLRGVLRREEQETAKLKADLALANARTEFVEVVRAAVARQEVIDAIRAQPPQLEGEQ